jgi:hypothetical protein
MASDTLRAQLARLLSWEDAHVGFDRMPQIGFNSAAHILTEEAFAMRRFAFFLSVAALVACARTDTDTADTTALGDTAMGAGVPAPAPTPISLTDVRGRWTVRGSSQTGDSLVGYTMVTTGTRSGWTITFPNRRPIPVRVVAVEGDSIITEAGPYESVLRPGVQVRTRGVFRLQNGELVGVTEARYPSGDTLVFVQTRGIRIP